MLVNPFYSYLTNHRSVDLASLPFHDIITSDYVPVARHPIADEIFKLAFTEDLIHSQRLINVVRLMILRGVLHKFLQTSVDSGLDLQELESQYLTRNRPITDSGVTLAFSGRLRSSYYRMIRINVSVSGSDVIVVNHDGQPYNVAATLTTNKVVITFPVDSCAITIDRGILPAGINWSSIPENMLLSLETNKYVIAGLLDRFADAVTTTLDSSAVTNLIDSARAECSFYALSAIGILIASHTAKLSGEEYL